MLVLLLVLMQMLAQVVAIRAISIKVASMKEDWITTTIATTFTILRLMSSICMQAMMEYPSNNNSYLSIITVTVQWVAISGTKTIVQSVQITAASSQISIISFNRTITTTTEYINQITTIIPIQIHRTWTQQHLKPRILSTVMVRTTITTTSKVVRFLTTTKACNPIMQWVIIPISKQTAKPTVALFDKNMTILLLKHHISSWLIHQNVFLFVAYFSEKKEKCILTVFCFLLEGVIYLNPWKVQIKSNKSHKFS